MLITSLENERVKNYIKLKDRKYRKKTNTFIVEGEHLVLEAYKSNSIIELIIEKDEKPIVDCETIYVTQEIINKISSLDTPSKIMALCKINENNKIVGNKVLYLDNIQDPGNLGTIIRSSLAFNVDTIILSKDTVDLYNPKVIRSTQGMFFHTNIIIKDFNEIYDELIDKKIPIFGTDVNNGINVTNIKDKDKYCLVMGNEGNGVSKEILSLCDKSIYIDMNNKVESLNVAVATSIILYELNK